MVLMTNKNKKENPKMKNFQSGLEIVPEGGGTGGVERWPLPFAFLIGEIRCLIHRCPQNPKVVAHV